MPFKQQYIPKTADRVNKETPIQRSDSCFIIKGNTFSEEDQLKPRLLAHLLHEERIKETAKRLSKPQFITFESEVSRVIPYEAEGKYEDKMPLRQAHMYMNTGKVKIRSHDVRKRPFQYSQSINVKLPDPPFRGWNPTGLPNHDCLYNKQTIRNSSFPRLYYQDSWRQNHRFFLDRLKVERPKQIKSYSVHGSSYKY